MVGYFRVRATLYPVHNGSGGKNRQGFLAGYILLAVLLRRKEK